MFEFGLIHLTVWGLEEIHIKSESNQTLQSSLLNICWRFSVQNVHFAYTLKSLKTSSVVRNLGNYGTWFNLFESMEKYNI